MSARLPSALLVKAMLRRVHDAGGSGAVLARGDDQGGAVLIAAVERGGIPQFYERGLGSDGAAALIETGPREPSVDEADAYWRRRVALDPDLWVIELDIAGAERFAAETIAID